jgi:hypothetical protein
MSSLFSIPSTTNLPSKVNTAKYNKIPRIIESLTHAKLEVVKQFKKTTSTYEKRELNKLVKKLQGHIDKLDKVTNNYLINKAKKLINESGALKRKTMKHIKRLQSKQSRSQKKSQKKRKKSKKVKTKRRRSKRR